MQHEAENNHIHIKARLQDVQEMIYGISKKFVAKAHAYSDPLYPNTNPYADYLPVVATVFVRDQQVDSDGTLRFLDMQVQDKTLFVSKLQLAPTGLLVPDIHTDDMLTGLNKDCHINPDNTLHVDTLQLIRGVIQAGDATLQETIGIDILAHALKLDAQVSFLSNPSVELLQNNLINLKLLVRLSPEKLDTLITQLNTHPNRHPQVQFGIKTLNRQDYPTINTTLN